MENRITITGNVENIKKVNYVDIKDTENKIGNCYIVKALASKQQITKEGQRVEIQGWEKEFRPGKKFFVIHKIKRLEEEKKDYSREIETANKLGRSHYATEYFGDVLNTILERAHISGNESDELVEFEMCDPQINEGQYVGIAKRICSTRLNCLNYSDGGGGRYFAFHASRLVEGLQGINLANKKGGAKFEGKIKIEVLRVRFKGTAFSCAAYQDYGIDEIENERYEYGADWRRGDESAPNRFKRGELMGGFRELLNGKKKDKAGKAFNFQNLSTPLVDAVPYLPHDHNEELKKRVLKMTEEEIGKTGVEVRKVRITIVR